MNSQEDDFFDEAKLVAALRERMKVEISCVQKVDDGYRIVIAQDIPDRDSLWYRNKVNVVEVVIEEGVKSIGDKAFCFFET